MSTKVKTIAHMWKEYCHRSFGKDLGNVSQIQLKECEKVFHFAIGAFLVELNEGVAELPEKEGAEALQKYTEEVESFGNRAVLEHKLRLT